MVKLFLLFIIFFNSPLTFANPKILNLQNPMFPHSVKKSGPWFEGWYYRLTDHHQKISIAVIGTSAFEDGQIIPGYAALLFQVPGESAMRSIEKYPENSTMGLTIDKNDFIWNSGAYGYLKSDEVHFQMDDVSLKLKVHTKKPWDQFEFLGPAGLSHLISILPLHWFVENTSGKASYHLSYKENGKIRSFQGVGHIHQEKNWGEVFPDAWMWVQAISADGQSSLALAGGDVEWGEFTFNTFLVGYRSEDLVINFNLADDLLTTFEKSMDSCRGVFRLDAQNQNHRMVVTAKAPKESFGYVSIPTKNGYLPEGGIESFVAEVDVEIYEHHLLSLTQDRLIKKDKFRLAALEFGGSYMNLSCPLNP